MKLTLSGIQTDRAAFEAAGYRLPIFEYETIKKNTYERPVWIHFGAGNIFRAFQANVMQTLLNGALWTQVLSLRKAKITRSLKNACVPTITYPFWLP